MFRVVSLLILITVGLAGACKTFDVPKNLPADELLALGKSLLDKKQYEAAAKTFDYLKTRYFYTYYAEEAHYYLAKTYFLWKKYEQALTEYELFLSLYPESYYLEAVQLEMAICYYKMAPSHALDQSLTEKALSMFDQFIETFPNSSRIDEAKKYRQLCIDKLALKDIAVAKFYLKNGHPKSALIYLQGVLEKYPETTLREEVEKLVAECEHKLHGEIQKN